MAPVCETTLVVALLLPIVIYHHDHSSIGRNGLAFGGGGFKLFNARLFALPMNANESQGKLKPARNDPHHIVVGPNGHKCVIERWIKLENLLMQVTSGL